MMKKRANVWAMLLAAAVSVSMLGGCGGSSGGEAPAAEGAASGGSSAAQEATTEGQPVKLTIWDWDEAHLTHMTEFYHGKYPDVSFDTLVVAATEYMQKFQSALASGSGVPDVVLGEMAYRGRLFELGVLEDLSKAPYNLDPAQMFDFAVELQSGPGGELLGVEQQICPSGFAYRRDLAKEYLGTDDPDELSKRFDTWENFLEEGKQVKEKSGGKVTIFPGISVLMQETLKGQNAAPYIEGDTIDLTSRYSGVFEIATMFNQAGILGKQERETPALNSGMAAGEFICYPAAPWTLKWNIATNDPEGSGRWGLTTAPGDGFTAGGTSVSIYTGSENKQAAWDYIRFTYCDGEGVQEAFKQFGFMTGFKAPYEEENPYFFTEKGQYDDFFGGQHIAQYFIDTIAVKTIGQRQTKNEASVNEAYLSVAAQMANNPAMTAQEALESLKKEVLVLIPSATIK